MAASITVVEPADRQLSSTLRAAELRVASTLLSQEAPALDGQRPPDVLVVDIRTQGAFPTWTGGLKRQFPAMAIVVVASAHDPVLMLEAMRAGVSEFVAEPLTAESLSEAVERVAGEHAASDTNGRVLAFVGAKGGVGTTTLAVNVAVALAEGRPDEVLLIDLHITSHGDAALLLGVEPRFSVADAFENTKRLDGTFFRGLLTHTKYGVELLAAPDRPILRQSDGGQVKTLLKRAASLFPLVVLDVPHTDFGTLDALDPITSVTLVLNQELPTIRRAAQVAALLRQRYGKETVGSAVSRYDPRADIGQDDIEQVAELPVWAVVPSEYHKVISAANAGRPLASDNHSKVASSVMQFARHLSGSEPAVSTKARPAKPARRLGGVFSLG